MITSFEVGAVFEIDSQPALESLTALSEKMQGLLATAAELKGEFASLGRTNPFGRATRGADNLQEAIFKTTGAYRGMGEGAAAAGATAEKAAAGAATAVDGIGTAIDRVDAKFQALRTNMERAITMPALSGGGGGDTLDGEVISPLGGPRRAIGYDAGTIDGHAEEVIRDRLLLGGGYGGGSGGGLVPSLGDSSGSYSGRSGPYNSRRTDVMTSDEEDIGGPPGRGPMSLNYKPPGTGGGPGAGVALLEGIGFFESMKLAMQEDLNLRLTELSLQLPTSGPLEAGYKEKLRAIARSASEGTIYSEGVTAAAMPVLAGPSGFQGPEGVEQFGSLFPIALRSAEVAQQRKLGGLDDTLRANMSYGHMLGTYSGQPAIDSLNQLQAIGGSVGKTPGEEEKVLSYSVPIGKALGGNVEDIADVTGFIQRQGLNSTTAGTGLAALMLQLTHAETLDAHDTHARARRKSAESEFASAMHLTPQAVHQLRNTNRESKKVEALEDIGLLDHQGHLADRLPTGGIDIKGVAHRINVFATRHPDQWARDSQSLDTRALRAGAMLADQTPGMDLNQFVEHRRGTPTAEAQQKALAETPLQHFEQMVARFSDGLNVLGTAMLSKSDLLIRGVTDVTTGANHLLQEHPEAAAGLGGLGVTAMTSQALKAAGGWLTKRGMTGVGGRMAGLGELGPAAMVPALGLVASDAVTSLFDWGQDAIFGSGSAARSHQKEDHLLDADGGLFGTIGKIFTGSSAHAATTRGAAASPVVTNSNNTSTVTIGGINVTVSGGSDPAATGSTIGSSIMSFLRTHLTTAAGAGQATTHAAETVGIHP